MGKTKHLIINLANFFDAELFREFSDRHIIIGPTLLFWCFNHLLMLYLQLRASPWRGAPKRGVLDYQKMDNDQTHKFLLRVCIADTLHDDGKFTGFISGTWTRSSRRRHATCRPASRWRTLCGLCAILRPSLTLVCTCVCTLSRLIHAHGTGAAGVAVKGSVPGTSEAQTPLTPRMPRAVSTFVQSTPGPRRLLRSYVSGGEECLT